MGKYNSYDNECPVKNLKKEEEADSLRSPKLDYLLEDDRENLYFVELKTSSESFKKEQFDRYKGYIYLEKGVNPVEKLWEHYNHILKKYNILNTYNNRINENKENCVKLNGTKKYAYHGKISGILLN